MQSHNITVESIEKGLGKKFRFPDEIGELLKRSGEKDAPPLFEEIIFQAKFVTKTGEVMKRIGRGADGFDKLAAEYQAGIERCSDLLRTFVKESPDPLKDRINNDFLTLTPEKFANLLGLLSDLATVKNWHLDTSSTLSRSSSAARSTPAGAHRDLKHVRSTAVLTELLFVAYMIAEPPVTTLGWILAIMLLVLIASMAYLLTLSLRITTKG